MRRSVSVLRLQADDVAALTRCLQSVLNNLDDASLEADIGENRLQLRRLELRLTRENAEARRAWLRASGRQLAGRVRS